MMAAKARLFDDTAALAQVLATTDPYAAKTIGRRVRGFDPARWNAHAYRIVTAGNLAKFGQHPDLAAFLDSTGDRVLVEASPSVRIWGIGLGSTDSRTTDPRRGAGRTCSGSH